MARALVNKRDSLSITESSRGQESGFSEQVPSTTIGPESDVAHSGEAVAVNDQKPVTIYTWKVMTVGDEGLKQAIYDFINTTKEGIKVTPDITRGREKKFVFNFYGSMGKSIAPGEIGEFEVNFKYPPTVGTVSSSSNTNVA